MGLLHIHNNFCQTRYPRRKEYRTRQCNCKVPGVWLRLWDAEREAALEGGQGAGRSEVVVCLAHVCHVLRRGQSSEQHSAPPVWDQDTVHWAALEVVEAGVRSTSRLIGATKNNLFLSTMPA
ncbi:unnamed protein product [Gadus morhua 'NCC']